MTLKMAVKQDPAIERWATMRENTHLYYKLTGKNVLIAIFLGLAFPAAIWTGSIMQFNRTDALNGKNRLPMLGRGVPLNPPTPTESE